MKFNEIDAISLKELIRDKKLALLPVGATEIHGPHLPAGTDSILAERLCERLAKRTGGIVLPPLHYTQVWSLGEFTGSIGISTKLLTEMICELLLEIIRNGFETAVIVNAHLGNVNAIKEGARMALKANEQLKVLYFSYPGANERINQVMDRGSFHGSFFHADEIETSYMLYLADEYVDMTKAVSESPKVPPLIDVAPIRWGSFTSTAVMGNAAAATREKGQLVIDHVIDEMCRLIELSERQEQ